MLRKERELKKIKPVASLFTICLLLTNLLFLSSAAYAQSNFTRKSRDIFSSGSIMQSNQRLLKIPHAVQGFVIKIDDPLVRSVTLSWKPNPASDGVDKYAIYLMNALLPQYTQGLVTTTKKTRITLKTWDSGTRIGKQPSGTVFIIPDDSVTMFVIAHNKYGWGVAFKDAIYPDHSKLPLMSNARFEEYAPLQVYGTWDCTPAFEEYYSVHC